MKVIRLSGLAVVMATGSLAAVAVAVGAPSGTVKVIGDVRITTSPEEDFIPSWSPDGRQITYTSYASGSEEIWIMNADGTGKKQLTVDPHGDWSPAWSPNGREILFTSDRTGQNQIWTMATDGSGQRQLTAPASPASGPPVWSRDPSWSADGMRIIFTSNRSGKDENWVMDRDGKNWFRHAQMDGEHWHPSFSPDGKQVLFSSNRGGEWGLWISDIDGSNARRLVPDLRFDNNPSSSWSRDGALIAFRTADGNMWVAGPNGAGAAMVVRDGTVAGWRSSWSPDGKLLAYTSDRSGNADVWVLTLTR